MPLETTKRQLMTPALERSFLLQHLTPDEGESLIDRARLTKLERGETLWEHGAQVDFIGLVLEGYVKMQRFLPNGGSLTMEIMGPSHLFGLSGLVTELGCPLAATGLTPALVAKLPKALIQEFLLQNAVLGRTLLKSTSLRFHTVLDISAARGIESAEEKVAAALVLVLDGFSEPEPEGMRLTIPLTRQDIADMAGVTLETTIRIMSRWTKQGWIVTERQSIWIRQEAPLRALIQGHRAF